MRFTKTGSRQNNEQGLQELGIMIDLVKTIAEAPAKEPVASLE
jgi:hypothetical protein